MAEDLLAWLARKEREYLKVAENMRGDPEDTYADAARFSECAAEILRTQFATVTRERDEAVAQCASVLLLAQTFLCSCPNEGGQHDSDCAVAQLSSFPRAEAMLAVVEAARRAVQCGGTLLLADALRAYDNPEESNG